MQVASEKEDHDKNKTLCPRSIKERLRVKINQLLEGRLFRTYEVSFARTKFTKKWIPVEGDGDGYLGCKPEFKEDWITVRKIVPENEVGLWAKLHLGWWDALDAKIAQP